MRWSGVLLILAACNAPPLEPGGFRLVITEDAFWSEIDARYQIEPGGALIGHNSDGYFTCDELLTAEQQVDLARLLDRAEVLDRGDSGDPGCVDQSEWTFEIVGTSGEATGMHNRFVYDPCGDGDEDRDVDAVINALWDRVATSTAAGRCGTCTPELEPASCYGHEFGVASFCSGPERADCSATATEEVVDCPFVGAFACDGERWIPATTWTLTEASVYAFEDVSISYRVVLSVDVDNVGWAPLRLTEMDQFLEARDVVGDPMEFERITVSGQDVPGHTRTTVTVWYQSPASSTSLGTLALRERPWDGVPFGAPVVVTQIEGLPPAP